RSTEASAMTPAPDTQAPTIPTGLVVLGVGSSQIHLGWSASSDDVGVTAYRVYRNGALVAILGNVTSYADTGLSPSTLYEYSVAACDAAVNCSARSETVLAMTVPVVAMPRVSAGGLHTAVLKSDGTLWTWGYNTYGQLGGGSAEPFRSSPAQIGTATNWTAVTADYNQTFALKSNGTLWAWGYNGAGQLGDGTTVNHTSPVQIGRATNWAAVAAGSSQDGRVER